jgi:hypothetical protein
MIGQIRVINIFFQRRHRVITIKTKIPPPQTEVTIADFG